MYKIVLLLLSVMLLTACSNKDTNDIETEESTSAPMYIEDGPIVLDTGFTVTLSPGDRMLDDYMTVEAVNFNYKLDILLHNKTDILRAYEIEYNTKRQKSDKWGIVSCDDFTIAGIKLTDGYYCILEADTTDTEAVINHLPTIN